MKRKFPWFVRLNNYLNEPVSSKFKGIAIASSIIYVILMFILGSAFIKISIPVFILITFGLPILDIVSMRWIMKNWV